MIRILLVMMILSFSLATLAQPKPIFRSQTLAGILVSEGETSPQVQTINGVGFKNWFAGIGTGIDWTSQRSIPLFFSANKFLASKAVPLYFSGDVGINFPWVQQGRYYFADPGSDHPGLYWAGGVGWKFGMKKSNNAVLLNLGYNSKRFLNKQEIVSPCLVPPCPVSTTTYDYRLRRLSLRVGWMF